MMKKAKPGRRFRFGALVFILVVTAVLLYMAYAYERTGTLYPTMELLDGRPTFRFPYVGQGDCTLTTWQGDAVLVDAGPSSSAVSCAEYVRSYAPNVDLMVITHPHEDHMGGAAEILSIVKVKTLILPTAASDEPFYQRTLDEAARQHTDVLFLDKAVELEVGSLTVTIIPPIGMTDDNLNNASMFVRIDAGETSLLVTGDAEWEEEVHMLSICPADFLDCDILKVPHHGSSTSTGVPLLNAVTPETCVISVGRNNSYGHPAWETTERLKSYKTYRTDRDGSVVLRGEK